LFGRDCVDFNAEPDKVTNTGQFVLALDPSRFQPLDQFKSEVDRHIREHAQHKSAARDKVFVCPASSERSVVSIASATDWRLAPELLTQLDKLGSRACRSKRCASVPRLHTGITQRPHL
jgi:LDH2 family malate/lactate/ureidoglycolate dehydrogenase